MLYEHSHPSTYVTNTKQKQKKNIMITAVLKAYSHCYNMNCRILESVKKHGRLEKHIVCT